MPTTAYVIHWGPETERFSFAGEMNQTWLYQTNIMRTFARTPQECEARYHDQARVRTKVRAAKTVQLERVP